MKRIIEKILRKIAFFESEKTEKGFNEVNKRLDKLIALNNPKEPADTITTSQDSQPKKYAIIRGTEQFIVDQLVIYSRKEWFKLEAFYFDGVNNEASIVVSYRA